MNRVSHRSVLRLTLHAKQSLVEYCTRFTDTVPFPFSLLHDELCEAILADQVTESGIPYALNTSGWKRTKRVRILPTQPIVDAHLIL